MADDGGKPKVLLVEDSATHRALISDALGQLGVEVEIAQDGLHGRALALGGGFDLVVSDVLLPGLSGFDLCLAVKGNEATRSTPVLLMSGMTDSSNFMRSVRSGADAYLPKTTPIERVMGTVQRLLEPRPPRKPNGEGH